MKAYLLLFRQLSEFRFLYLARVDSHFEKAKKLFNSVVTIPLAELCRYFQVRKAWDLRQYRSVTDADLIFRNPAKPRFVGERFEHLYRGWKVGRVTEADKDCTVFVTRGQQQWILLASHSRFAGSVWAIAEIV